LQMLDANENMSKNDKSLREWVDYETQTKNRINFLESHLIPDVNLDLDHFDEYFQKRKQLLTEKLKSILL
ncbi:MAG: DUF262 domain-containing protein, partial [Acinetobacter sp.]|nr:DUF262 domain-containing protein [Acinetobacter sp.]